MSTDRETLQRIAPIAADLAAWIARGNVSPSDAWLVLALQCAEISQMSDGTREEFIAGMSGVWSIMTILRREADAHGDSHSR